MSENEKELFFYQFALIEYIATTIYWYNSTLPQQYIGTKVYCYINSFKILFFIFFVMKFGAAQYFYNYYFLILNLGICIKIIFILV